MSFSKLLSAGLALIAMTQAAPASNYWTPAPNGPAQTAPCAGRVTKVDFLGNVTSSNTYSSRDGGFAGNIGSTHIISYGDTSQCKVGSDKDNCWDGSNFVGSNSAAFATEDPLVVDDFNLFGGNKAQQFCGKMNIPQEQNNVFFAIGISNVVETGPHTGVVYTMLNDRTMGSDGLADDNFLGNGIGIIDTSGEYPVCNRTTQYWWDAKTEPMWGSNTAVDGRDGYIYVFGNLLGGDWTRQWSVYAARVKTGQATDLNSYQYWNGKTWSSTRLRNPTPDQAVLQGAPPGQIYWNNYLNCWVALTRDPTGMWTLDIQTSSSLTGPWSKMDRVYEETDLHPQPTAIYSPSAQPQYDPSHQTLVVTYSAYGPIAAVKLHFSK